MEPGDAREMVEQAETFVAAMRAEFMDDLHMLAVTAPARERIERMDLSTLPPGWRRFPAPVRQAGHGTRQGNSQRVRCAEGEPGTTGVALTTSAFCAR